MHKQLAAAFYRFVPLPDYQALRRPLLERAEALGLKGTVLLAPEGINGTLSGPQAGLQAWFDALAEDKRFEALMPRLSPVIGPPFLRLKVKLKREIISFGTDEIDPIRATGVHVPPEDWNALIEDPKTLLLDTRNRYEVATGTFRNAVDPGIDRFRDLPSYMDKALDPQRHKRVAMFCTGGIRCEKASAWLLTRGFEEVYQLQGGILNYLEKTPEQDSLWQGECFVFDERVTVGHGLQPGSHTSCRGCRRPLSPEDRRSPDYEEGVHCPYCKGENPAREARARARWRQVQLAEQRGLAHIGVSTEAQKSARSLERTTEDQGNRDPR